MSRVYYAFNEMERFSIKRNLHMYNLALQTAAHRRDKDAAEDILQSSFHLAILLIVLVFSSPTGIAILCARVTLLLTVTVTYV